MWRSVKGAIDELRKITTLLENLNVKAGSNNTKTVKRNKGGITINVCLYGSHSDYTDES